MSDSFLYGARLDAVRMVSTLSHLFSANLAAQAHGRAATPICIWGTHGIGKTMLVEAYARQRGWAYACCAPAQLEEMGDLNGLPVLEEVNGQQVTRFAPPNWVPREPGPGILLLDDIVGMVSAHHYEELVHPHLRRIFDEFDGLIRVYHNDTPCPHLLEKLAQAGFEVFNFSHEMDIGEVKAKMGHRVAVMGNVPPLDVGVRGTPEEVVRWAKICLDKAASDGGMILSFGGGVSPGTPPQNIDALFQAVHEWEEDQR